MSDIYKERFTALPTLDRRLLIAMSAVALVALALGILGGLLTALGRAGFVDMLPRTGYRFLTVHGVSVFFYWLFVAQAALLLGFAAAEGGRGIAWRRVAWSGFALMLAGFGFSITGAHLGTPLLYDGAPQLGADHPGAMLVFNLGYLLLGLGLMVLPAAAIATLLMPCWQGRQARLSAVGFALFAWAGFLMVSGFAALYVFLPGTLWALGLGELPANHSTNWHIVFHNMHYLPLMATVILWYVLVRALTGVKSVFGERFSKIVFAMYLVFVPPTSLYHMFLEPDLPGVVRVTGSLLSLFVSVPTLTAFLIIVASPEVHARAQGGRMGGPGSDRSWHARWPDVSELERSSRDWTVRSSGSSSSQLHSSAPRSVLWRELVPRWSRSSAKRWFSRSTFFCGDNTLARAAASSIASGMPSSRRQICAIAAAFSSVNVKRGLAIRARSTKSSTASYCEISTARYCS